MRSLVDTNILLYANDRNETVKRVRALEVIEQLSASGELVLSVQCLNEFSAVALRRGIPIADVRAKIGVLHDLAEVLPLTDVITLAALEAVEHHVLSFWDALIWAAARKADITVVISEDFQHGRVLDGVRFVDPYRESREVPTRLSRTQPCWSVVGNWRVLRQNRIAAAFLRQ